MIKLHRLNGEEFVLNAAHIETIEEKPDTVITLTNDRKYLVREKMNEVIQRIVEFQGQVRVLADTSSVDRLEEDRKA